MKTTGIHNLNERLDEATADRLAKLRTVPVDTSRLESRLRQRIPQLRRRTQERHRRLFLPRPLQAVAAGFILLGIVLAAVIALSSGPAMASADRLAQVHEDVTSGHSRMVTVSSVEAAAVAMFQQWPQIPALPDVPDDQVMACCVHEVGRKKMACVSLAVDGVPITMAVADSADIKVPAGPAIVRKGVTYRIGSAKGINMAMTERGGRWVCLMGRLPTDRLIDLAVRLKF